MTYLLCDFCLLRLTVICTATLTSSVLIVPADVSVLGRLLSTGDDNEQQLQRSIMYGSDTFD